MIKSLLAAFPPSPWKGINTSDITSLQVIPLLIANVIQILLSLAGALAVIFIVWSGIQFVTSQGDPGKVKDARNGIFNAIFGLILATGAYLLVELFARRLGA